MRRWIPVAGGVFVFIMFYCLFLLRANRDYRKIILLLPALLNWATIMIAAPVACSFRYINICLLIIPVEFMILCLSTRKEN